MQLKDILVHLDASPRCDARVDLAVGLAARHGAHLTGLFVIDLPPADVFYGFPSGTANLQPVDDITALMRATATEDAGHAEASFRDRLRREGLRGEWRLVEGRAGPTVALHGRYADLIVAAQPDPNPLAAGRPVDLSASTLASSGRPVLMVPFAGSFPTVGEEVLVGWNASAEAARAVNAALPILCRARRVTVLSINAHSGNAQSGIGGGDTPAADIALHLARHGIAAAAAHTVAADISEGDALLSYAADLGADLLVTGLYGHSRMREMVFGGVTRTLLTEMTIPVFMVH